MASRTSTVLIFGKTGDGKSTLANMLVSQDLSPIHDDTFPIGDGMTGVTTACQTAEGNGYKVIDTVGLGEEETRGKSADDIIVEFLNRTKQVYSHVIFVKDAGRMDQLDRAIWQIFLRVFEVTKPAFVFVLTKTPSLPEKWLENNRHTLMREYPECEGRFVCVNFPPYDRDLELIRNREMRKNSLQHLRRYLEKMRKVNKHQTFRPAHYELEGEPLRSYSSRILSTFQTLAEKYNINLGTFAHSLGIAGSIATIVSVGAAAACTIM